MHLFRKTISSVISCVLVCGALTLLISCGGGNNSSNSGTGTVSKIKKRLFVLNSQAPGIYGLGSLIYILDADKDQVYPVPLNISSSPGYDRMTETSDKKLTLVYSSTIGGLYVIDNATEAAVGAVSLGGGSESLVTMSDNKTAVAAVRNLPVTNKPNGAVLLVDFSTPASPAISSTISVPEAHRIAINHAGTKVLAFADDTDSLYVIDTTAKTATAVPGFDRPVNAIFSSDDSKAYVLNCGAECGGTAASVTVFNMSDSSLGANVPVGGATIGYLDGTKLYVAGSPNGVGQLDVVDTSSMTRTTTGLAIANGYHDRMSLADGGKLYIGSYGCTVVDNKGCLSIFTTGSGTAVIATSNTPGDITGIQPIIGRNIVYVSIAGELIVFDVNTDAPRASGSPFDVVGTAEDVKLID